MAWKRVSPEGDIRKWEDGVVVVGTLIERRENKYGPLVTISTEHGPATFGCPMILSKKLAEVLIGALVRIECTGKVTGKSGQPYWTFVVDTDDGAPSTEQIAAPAHADDSDINF